MADALSDILSLTQAFGQFSNSVVQLHNTRVQVETAAKSAVINKANYDFMQRFNLNPGDPNRISLDEGDQNYWRTALQDYEGQVETHLGSIKNPRVQNAVRQNLQSSSQDFALKLSNVVAQAEIQQTQEQLIVGFDAYAEQGQYEQALALAEMADTEGLLSPAQRALFEKERVIPARAGIKWRTISTVMGELPPPRKIKITDPETGEVTEQEVEGIRGNDFDAKRKAVRESTTDLNERAVLMDRITTDEQAYAKNIDEYIKIQKENEAKYGSSPAFYNRMMAEYLDNVNNLTSNQNTQFYDTLQRWDGASIEQKLDLEFTKYIGDYGRGITKNEAQQYKARFKAFAEQNRGTSAVPAGYDQAVVERMNQIDSWVVNDNGEGRKELYDKIAGVLKFDFDLMSQVGSGSGVYDIEKQIQNAAWRVRNEFPEYLDDFMNTVFTLRSKLAGMDQFSGISRYFEGGATEETVLMNIGNSLRAKIGSKEADTLIKIGKNWRDQGKLSNDERGAAMLVTDAFIAFEKAGNLPGFKEKSPAQKMQLMRDLIEQRMEFDAYANKSLIEKTFGNRKEVVDFMRLADQAQFGLWEEAALSNWYHDMASYVVEYKIKPLQAAGKMPSDRLIPITLPGMGPNDMMFRDADGYLYDVYPSERNNTLEIKKSKNPYKEGTTIEWGNPLYPGNGPVSQGDILTGTETGAILAARSGSMATEVGSWTPKPQPSAMDTSSWPQTMESYKWPLPGTTPTEWQKVSLPDRLKKYAAAGYVWDAAKERFWSKADIAAGKHLE